MKLSPTIRPRARGFTLAEVAVAIVIVGMGLMWILEGMNLAKLTAAHTRNYKLARELALVTLGQIESGEYQEDIARGLAGNYAEEGYPDFVYEVIVGDEGFRETADDGTFDSWRPRETSSTDEEDEDKKDEEQPFEKVKIKVVFPRMKEFTNELVLERWMPWKQVYGESDEAESDASATADGDSSSSGSRNSSRSGLDPGGSSRSRDTGGLPLGGGNR